MEDSEEQFLRKNKDDLGDNINHKEKLLIKAFELHSKGNIQEAIKIYQIFISKGFSDSRVFLNYGIILQQLGRLKEAEIYTRKALQLNQNYALAYSNLGNILKDLGKLEEAAIFTRKAIQLDPNFSEAYSNLGTILKDLKKLT